MAAENVRGSVGIDARGLKSFITATRKASPIASKGIRTGLRAGGELVAEEARKIAGQHSRSIPPTIRTTVYGGTVSVRAGKGVPLAALYELGNKGASPDSPTFRHRVFNDPDTWVEQDRYAFLRPAADAKGAAVEAAVMKVADDIADVLSGHINL